MSWRVRSLAIVILVASGRPAALLAVEETNARSAAVGFVKRHCVSCHGEARREHDLRLDDLVGNVSVEGSRWAMVVKAVREQTMPPDDAKQPSDSARREFVGWVLRQLGEHPQRKPNLGNLVPHDLLFGAESQAARTPDKSPAVGLGHGAAPRLWRISPAGYLGWTEDVGRGRPVGIVQPFSLGPERGIKDFAALARVDEPTVEILFRNATLLVERQTAHEIKEGRVSAKHDTVREFTDLMDPAATPTREQLARAIQRQFKLAIGRDTASQEVERFVALYETCATTGDRPSAIKAMLTAILLQTDTIFRSELGGPEGMLTSREAALAVGAALLHRRDQRLIDAADRGELSTREQIAEHLRRILDDPKIEKPRLLGFFHEYLEYANALEVFKDEPKDLWHRPDQHVKDTDRLILHLLARDEDVFRQMLITPLAFVNAKTSTDKQTRREVLQRSLIPNAHNQRGKALPESFYDLTEWPADQPVTQAPDTRLGILMQPSWLMAWSENFHNDIVRRGRFIRERLLGGTVPDLPIGVAAMVPGDKTRTLRDRVSSATRAEQCWKCHRLMDDLGLPFENFDHYGRRLSTDFVLDPEATKKNVDYKGKPQGDVLRPVPLDATGLVAETGDPTLDGPVQSPHELVTRLANSDRCRQVWIRHVFRYYLGRNESLSDAATLQAADRAYLTSNGSFKALLVSLLTSDSFLKRTPNRPDQDRRDEPANSE